MVQTTNRHFREIADGKLKLNFHPGQSRAWESQRRFVVMLAGTQGGKTTFAPHWLYREINRQGPGDYLAVTATFPLLQLKFLPEMQYVFETLLKWGEYRDSAKTIVSHDRIHGAEASRIIFGSAKNPESVESATAKAAVLDEAGQRQFRRDAWEAIQRRLSIHQGRALIATTIYCLGWLKTELYDPWMNGDPQIDVIQFDSILNPMFPREEYERARERLPRWKFRMFYQGQFDRPAGMVYDCFDEAVAVIPRQPIPRQWLIYVGHDFGGSNPAAIFYAQDPDTGYFYAFNEYLPGPRSTEEHVRAFKQITQGYTVVKRVGGSHTEEGWRNDFTAQGWPISEPAVTEVEQGINRVYGLHKLNKVFIFKDLVNYLDEKMSYSRELDENNQPTEKIEDKARYHLMDAERYILSDFTPDAARANQGPNVWDYN